MAEKALKDESKEFEKKIKASPKKKYVLRLYIAGVTPKSTRAIMNIKKICEETIKDWREDMSLRLSIYISSRHWQKENG